MRIKTMMARCRRDFTAIYECEHCGDETRGSGYDDDNFHQNVVPTMTCSECGKQSGDDYNPRTPKYVAGMNL